MIQTKYVYTLVMRDSIFRAADIHPKLLESAIVQNVTENALLSVVSDGFKNKFSSQKNALRRGRKG